MTKQLRNTVQSISRTALKDYSYYKYSSLSVAASSVAVARIVCGIKPTWPEHLSKLSYIEFSDLEECSKKLLGDINVNSTAEMIEKAFAQLPKFSYICKSSKMKNDNSKTV